MTKLHPGLVQLVIIPIHFQQNGVGRGERLEAGWHCAARHTLAGDGKEG